jgi:MazG family protein
MQAEIASERNSFTLDSIAETASEKLKRRHPHVFGGVSVGTSEAVLKQWEEIKRAERASKGIHKEKSLLDGIARAFPALLRAQKIQKKAANVGFDWEKTSDIMEKIREEIVEVEDEIENLDSSGEVKRLNEEMGDLLFAVVNLARFLNIDSESVLQAATDKFMERFHLMESNVPKGRSFGDLSLFEMNELWEKAKRGEFKR